jgi:hypothetical protein
MEQKCQEIEGEQEGGEQLKMQNEMFKPGE